MKISCKKLALLALSTTLIASSFANQDIVIQKDRPDNFVDVSKVIPQIQIDARYYTDHNFVGRRINGYLAPLCLLTKPAATSLKKVEDQLLSMGLTLKTYDCYRPQTAVNDFANWAMQISNTKMQKEFYPTVDKKNLFKDDYIAYHSGHSRGSTLDLTIVSINSSIPKYTDGNKLVDCTAKNRFPDNSLDFGTGFDCFSLASHPDYQQISPQAKANRLLLRALMMDAGFKPYPTEWWHFTLVNEPYPNTYFDFPVQYMSQ